MKLILKLIGHLIIVSILTLITQVGGLIWLFGLAIAKWKNWKKLYVFPVIYLLCNLILIPPIATYFGRIPLPYFSDHVSPINLFYPLAFRNYVNPELKRLLMESSKTSNIKITYLDANFPFFNGFPLLPHRSHNDGKKVDLSFSYLDEKGLNTDKKPSKSGYGVFVNPKNVTSENCIKKGHWQYDFTKYLTFGANNDLQLNTSSTRTLLKSLLSKSETQTIFIEPYLKQKLKLKDEYRIRFHGCRAVRHDDHIHLQIK